MAIERADPQAPYAVVTLMIGENIQFRGQDVKEYQEEFVDLLQRGVELTGGDASRVSVVSIPDWSVTPFALGRDRAQIAEQIELFNDVNSQEAKRIGARYVDITSVSREAATDPNLLSEDGYTLRAKCIRRGRT